MLPILFTMFHIHFSQSLKPSLKSFHIILAITSGPSIPYRYRHVLWIDPWA